MSKTTHPTACILCSRNCGLVVDVEVEHSTGQSHLRTIRGDERHPVSHGYLCQKAARLDHYQNNSDRLDAPLRRRADGSFERITWDQAIAEIAARLVAIRSEHSGRALAYYGGGGQGNHLGGVYGGALVRAMQTRYHYSPLAQEKTGDFWVNGKLFGRQTCHTTEDVEHSDYVMFIGTNPWQAHGIVNARDTLRTIAADPERTMVVIDPKLTETARLADIHLQLRPGTDAYLLAAMLAIIVGEDLHDAAFIAQRTVGFAAVRDALAGIPIDDFIARADVDPELVRTVARGFARAKRGCVRVDLGIQQSLHSTLNSYLEKLLFLVTGHFGREGCNNFHTFLLPLIGHSAAPDAPGSKSWTTAATGMPEIGKLFPPNVLPAEILSNSPQRIRGLVVDSSNPAVSGADAKEYDRALRHLDLLVVIDVAMTETAEYAHYVLPAASQLEKWEATFFNLEFPTNCFHLRAPIVAARPGTLPEPEIYRRLLIAMGERDASYPLLKAIAKLDRRAPALRLYKAALTAVLATRPRLRPYAASILYDTLGPALPHGAQAAAPLWFAAHSYAQRHSAAVRRAGVQGEGYALGEALFARMLEGRSGVVVSTHTYEDTWKFVRHADRRIRLDIGELLTELHALSDSALPTDPRHPLVLIAGERRAYNANTIFRNPAWRKTDKEGVLHIHPVDAQRAGVEDGALALCESEHGAAKVHIAYNEGMRPGVVSLPHGYGLKYEDGAGRRAFGINVNVLTGADHRDAITATPFHKFVPVRISKLA